jgi:hypothetical protein
MAREASLKTAIYNEFLEPLSQRFIQSNTRKALRDTMLEPIDDDASLLDKVRSFLQRFFNIGRVSPEWMDTQHNGLPTGAP